MVAAGARRGAAADGSAPTEDLEFLRSLGVCSSIVVPIRARDRNLGALTLITAWSGRRYGADDVRFAQILASRIGLALDNAGLFSDLESIERRMDTVMSILDEAIVIHGADGELVFANPAAAEMLGFETTEDAVATPTAAIRDRFVIRDEEGNEVAAEALAGQPGAGRASSPSSQIAARDRPRDRAGALDADARRRRSTGPAGEVLYSVTAIEDVTDVKRAEFANRLLARTGELVSHSDRLPRDARAGAAGCSCPSSPTGARSRSPRDEGLARAGRDGRTATRARVATIRELRERYPLHVDDAGRRIGDVAAHRRAAS